MTTVQQQYEKWVYPLPIADLDAWAQSGEYDPSDPSKFAAHIWPERPHRPDASILIAGCGANQAAYFAKLNPGCRVLGIDISEASLAHSRMLKQRHGLDNLELHRLDLFDVAALGEQFDYVVSTGVLHHTTDPVRVARLLVDRMKEDGTIALGLYGQHARVGLYMLQDVFRSVGLGQTLQDVEIVRSTLESRPALHPARIVLQSVDAGYDSGLVDMFLHPQDRAYTIDQVFGFLEETGLTFQDWMDGGNYSPENCMRHTLPIFARIKAQPLREKWANMERLTCAQLLHAFFARKRPEIAWRPDWMSDAWLDAYPMLHPAAQLTEGEPPLLTRRAWSIPLSVGHAALLRTFDGTKTFRTAIKQVLRGDFPTQDGLQPTCDLLRWLYEASHLMVASRSHRI